MNDKREEGNENMIPNLLILHLFIGLRFACGVRYGMCGRFVGRESLTLSERGFMARTLSYGE